MYIYIFFTLISSIIIFFKISFILVRKDKQKTQKKIIKKTFCVFVLNYLRRSLLYSPPYFDLLAASSVISGIQLAITAYDIHKFLNNIHSLDFFF